MEFLAFSLPHYITIEKGSWYTITGEKMKNFLVVNDDGYLDQGIQILKDALRKFGNVYMVSPIEEQSGMSHRVSIFSKVVTLKVLSATELVIDGSPADCTRFGLDYFKDVNFDYVFSGVNNGANLGQDVFYSGTVAGAMEGALHNIPAAAFSVGSKNHFSIVRRHIDEVIAFVLDENRLRPGVMLNINFPNHKHDVMRGIRFTKQGVKETKVHFDAVQGGYLNRYEFLSRRDEEDDDFYAVNHGYVAITPVITDRTDYEYLKGAK